MGSQSKTLHCTSADGTRIAYDVSGEGPALFLLHGAGKTRRDWHNLGYVERLRNAYTVIAVDLRGSGESDHPEEITDYRIDHMTADVLAVANACALEQFAIWGYSLGGNLARYLGARTYRVMAVAIIGVPFGPAVHPDFDQFISEFIQKWSPVVEKERQAEVSGGKKLVSKIKGNIPVWLACFQAMRSWPSIEASELLCPALLLTGSKNKPTLAWIENHRADLDMEGMLVEIIPGLNHSQELTKIDRVFPVVRKFFDSQLLHA